MCTPHALPYTVLLYNAHGKHKKRADTQAYVRTNTQYITSVRSDTHTLVCVLHTNTLVCVLHTNTNNPVHTTTTALPCTHNNPITTLTHAPPHDPCSTWPPPQL